MVQNYCSRSQSSERIQLYEARVSFYSNFVCLDFVLDISDGIIRGGQFSTLSSSLFFGYSKEIINRGRRLPGVSDR